MSIRDFNYEEAKALYDQLVKSGYPAQILQSDKKWRVLVQGVIVNEQTSTKTLI